MRAADEDLPLTLDPVEYRGLEYQTGVSFSVFGLKGREELARGGRYSAGYPEDGVSEPATGFTLYMDAVLSASDTAPERPRLFLPPGTPWSEAAPWQAKGYAVVRGVTASADPRDRGQAAALQPRSDRQGSRAALGGRLPLRFGTSSAGRYRRRTAPRRGPG